MLTRDVQESSRWLETFRTPTWTDDHRFHHRLTAVDKELDRAVLNLCKWHPSSNEHSGRTAHWRSAQVFPAGAFIVFSCGSGAEWTAQPAGYPDLVWIAVADRAAVFRYNFVVRNIRPAHL